MTLEQLLRNVNWQVIVDNVGTVYDGTDETVARKSYNDYVTISKAGHGRAGGKNVSLFDDSDVVEEHRGDTMITTTVHLTITGGVVECVSLPNNVIVIVDDYDCPDDWDGGRFETTTREDPDGERYQRIKFEGIAT